MQVTPLLLAAFIAWQIAIAFALILLFRQTALLSMRVGILVPEDEQGFPLAAGAELPEDIADTVSEALSGSVTYLVWLTPTCATCRHFVNDMLASAERPFPDTMVVLLTGGPGNDADQIERQMSQYARVIREPESAAIVENLGFRTSPFALEVENGIVTGWTGLRGLDDLWNLRSARSESDAGEFAVTGSGKEESRGH